MVAKVKRTAKRVAEASEGGLYYAAKQIRFLPTGCTLLNLAVSERSDGGWPIGRIVNIIGDKSTGKTLLAEEAMMNFQRSFPTGKIHYRETEAAFDKDYAKWLGLDLAKVDFGPDREDDIWDTIQDVFEDLKKCLDEVDADVDRRARKLRDKSRKLKLADALEEARQSTVPSLYIVDSLDALSSEDELKRDPEEGSYNLGKQKVVNQLFRHYRKRMRLAKMLVIFISQTRQKIGPYIKGVKYRRVCGDPLDFFSSVVIYLSELGKLTKKIMIGDEEIVRVTGVRIRAKCEKNKIVAPHEECVFTIRFRYGIDDELSSLEYLKDLKRLEDAGYKKMPSDLAEVDAGQLRDTVSGVWHEIIKQFAPTRGKYAA
jgi:recombination protein RecA